MRSLYRRIPAAHRLLALPRLQEAARRSGREMVAEACTAALDDLRLRIADGALDELGVDEACQSLEDEILASLDLSSRPAYPTVINATGVLLHTNLGRAPLGAGSQPSLASYLALEYDIESGCRGQRLAPLRNRLARLFGSASAVMVNNNAAALFLLLNAHAKDREVIVSRGQLIEIGGSFRLPAVMEAAGCRLREVGCTNRTHLSDFEAAICDDTAALLVAHQSNFRISGFTTSPPTAELAALAERHGLPLMVDQGSGNIHDLRQWGLEHEETVAEILAAGAHAVCFSGDKLLGGPQAGIVVGASEWVEPLGRHPMYRALRPDKTALVLMDQVLRAHQSGRLQEIPLYAMLTQPVDRLRRRAAAIGSRLRRRGVPVRGRATRAALGGGTTPGKTLPSYGLAVTGDQALATRLRLGRPAIIGVITDDELVLDLRTVPAEQDRALEEAVAAAFEIDPAGGS